MKLDKDDQWLYDQIEANFPELHKKAINFLSSTQYNGFFYSGAILKIVYSDDLCKKYGVTVASFTEETRLNIRKDMGLPLNTEPSRIERYEGLINYIKNSGNYH